MKAPEQCSGAFLLDIAALVRNDFGHSFYITRYYIYFIDDILMAVKSSKKFDFWRVSSTQKKKAFGVSFKGLFLFESRCLVI